LIIILIISLFLVGCASQEEEVDEQNAQSAFIGGTDGLKLSFIQNAPPSDVFAAETDDNGNVVSTNGFNVNVKIENVGETQVGEYSVSLTGINPGDFGNPKMSVDISESLLPARRSAGQLLILIVLNLHMAQQLLVKLDLLI